jgi:hypothetical protein
MARSGADEAPGAVTPPGRPRITAQDLVRALREQFGDQYQQSYDEGKREFRDALVARFGIDRDQAGRLVDELEEARVIAFHHQGTGPGGEVPRVGLFDEPRTGSGASTDVEYAGRYWVIGREEVLPGAT